MFSHRDHTSDHRKKIHAPRTRKSIINCLELFLAEFLGLARIARKRAVGHDFYIVENLLFEKVFPKFRRGAKKSKETSKRQEKHLPKHVFHSKRRILKK